MGDFEQAIEFYQKALDISLATNGREHPSSAAGCVLILFFFFGLGWSLLAAMCSFLTQVQQSGGCVR
eukprot:m.72664 g.72664  ORF g.72664 m.72664 type:complete len:67 (+) comp50242_c0_seq25:1651-1851(+)